MCLCACIQMYACVTCNKTFLLLLLHGLLGFVEAPYRCTCAGTRNSHASSAACPLLINAKFIQIPSSLNHLPYTSTFPWQREVVPVHRAGRRGSRCAACNRLTWRIVYSQGQENVSVLQIHYSVPRSELLTIWPQLKYNYAYMTLMLMVCVDLFGCALKCFFFLH